LSSVQEHGAAGVDQQSCERDGSQSRALHGDWVPEAVHFLEEDPGPGGEQEQGADLGGHHLRTGETEAVQGAGRARRQHEGAQSDAQPSHVGDQMCAVGE
jgi:hypothetical protein